ncbi:MAG: hypothetical protein ACK4PR_14135, partial [Gammaproteobacteria bacterium]
DPSLTLFGSSVSLFNSLHKSSDANITKNLRSDEDDDEIQKFSADPTVDMSPYSSSPSTDETVHSSDIEVSSIKIRGLFVSHDIDFQTLKLTFQINTGQRPETWLNDGQGDHVTSYITIISTLLCATNSTNISLAIHSIKQLAYNLLDNESIKKIEMFEAPIVHEKKLRKKSINTLKQHGNLTDGQIALINHNLKFGKISQQASYLAKIVTCFLVILTTTISCVMD